MSYQKYEFLQKKGLEKIHKITYTCTDLIKYILKTICYYII